VSVLLLRDDYDDDDRGDDAELANDLSTSIVPAAGRV
jgi:hypothetical protein